MTHPENAGRVFVLRAVDPDTASIAHEARSEVADAATLCELLQKPLSEFDPHAVYELDPEDVITLVQHFDLEFDARAAVVELHPWHPNDDLPYCVHTGRELALMLAGTKPLAAFCDDHPSVHGLKVIPEKEFEPHVAAGRIVKREDIALPAPNATTVRGQRIGIRRVLYALPEEVWRIEAYLLLWKTAGGRRRVSRQPRAPAALDRTNPAFLGKTGPIGLRYFAHTWDSQHHSGARSMVDAKLPCVAPVVETADRTFND